MNSGPLWSGCGSVYGVAGREQEGDSGLLPAHTGQNLSAFSGDLPAFRVQLVHDLEPEIAFRYHSANLADLRRHRDRYDPRRKQRG